MVGDTYTIVDMAFWGWARLAPFVLGEEASAKYINVKRLVDEITARPAAARAIALKDKFTFKAEMDDEARGNMSAWNEPDAVKREILLDQCWSDGGVYLDPNVSLPGRDALAKKIGEVLAGRPGARLEFMPPSKPFSARVRTSSSSPRVTMKAAPRRSVPVFFGALRGNVS